MPVQSPAQKWNPVTNRFETVVAGSIQQSNTPIPANRNGTHNSGQINSSSTSPQSPKSCPMVWNSETGRYEPFTAGADRRAGADVGAEMRAEPPGSASVPGTQTTPKSSKSCPVVWNSETARFEPSTAGAIRHTEPEVRAEPPTLTSVKEIQSTPQQLASHCEANPAFNEWILPQPELNVPQPKKPSQTINNFWNLESVQTTTTKVPAEVNNSSQQKPHVEDQFKHLWPEPAHKRSTRKPSVEPFPIHPKLPSPLTASKQTLPILNGKLLSETEPKKAPQFAFSSTTTTAPAPKQPVLPPKADPHQSELNFISPISFTKYRPVDTKLVTYERRLIWPKTPSVQDRIYRHHNEVSELFPAQTQPREPSMDMNNGNHVVANHTNPFATAMLQGQAPSLRARSGLQDRLVRLQQNDTGTDINIIVSLAERNLSMRNVAHS